MHSHAHARSQSHQPHSNAEHNPHLTVAEEDDESRGRGHGHRSRSHGHPRYPFPKQHSPPTHPSEDQGGDSAHLAAASHASSSFRAKSHSPYHLRERGPHYLQSHGYGQGTNEYRSRSAEPKGLDGHGRHDRERRRGEGGEEEEDTRTHRQLLYDLAVEAMKENDFLVTFDGAAQEELNAIESSGVVTAPDSTYRDMRSLLWVSIDNDDTQDIDQVTAVETHEDGSVTLHVGIADVDAVIKRDGAIDEHAKNNTTSIYTPAAVFTMLPEKLCFDLTSLKPDIERKAVIVSITYADMSGEEIIKEDICLAMVVNHAKLAYNGVSAWLEGGPLPLPLQGRDDLQQNIKVQVCSWVFLFFPPSACKLSLARSM